MSILGGNWRPGRAGGPAPDSIAPNPDSPAPSVVGHLAATAVNACVEQVAEEAADLKRRARVTLRAVELSCLVFIVCVVTTTVYAIVVLG